VSTERARLEESRSDRMPSTWAASKLPDGAAWQSARAGPPQPLRLPDGRARVGTLSAQSRRRQSSAGRTRCIRAVCAAATPRATRGSPAGSRGAAAMQSCGAASGCPTSSRRAAPSGRPPLRRGCAQTLRGADTPCPTASRTDRTSRCWSRPPAATAAPWRHAASAARTLASTRWAVQRCPPRRWAPRGSRRTAVQPCPRCG
jgi:hypothetical protein